APEAGLIDLALRIGTERESYRARSELHNRDVKRAAGLAAKVADTLKMGGPPDDPDGAHIMLEALWLRQAFNEADERLLQDVLTSPNFRARAAAVRVLCQWRDRVPNSLEVLKRAAADKHPRVRLEAVRAASFWQVPEAAEVPIIAAELPSDQYIDFVHGE